MSRAWKQPNRSLPGWRNYSLPKKRDFFRKKTKRRYHSAPVSKSPPLKRIAFAPHKSGTLRKILRVDSAQLRADCLFERTHGLWKCIQAPPQLDWFTRVNHPDLIRSWLIKNHFDFHWLSIPAGTTVLSPAPVSTSAQRGNPGSCNGPGCPGQQQKAPWPHDDKSVPVEPLAENGVVTSSLLNCPARAGIP